MKVFFKGVFTIDEHLLILNRLKQETEGLWLVGRRADTHVPYVERMEELKWKKETKRKWVSQFLKKR